MKLFETMNLPLQVFFLKGIASSARAAKNPDMKFVFICVFLGIFASPRAYCQDSFVLQPISGADGVFETVLIGGDSVHRSSLQDDGSYYQYMYFRSDEPIPLKPFIWK